VQPLPGENAQETAIRMVREGATRADAQAWFDAHANDPIVGLPVPATPNTVLFKTDSLGREAFEPGALSRDDAILMFKSDALARLDVRTSVSVKQAGDTTIIRGEFYDKAGLIQGSAQRSINLAGRYAEHDGMSIAEELQGNGIATDLLRSHAAVYDQLGLTEVRVTAAGTNGLYTWARFGFDFKPVERFGAPDLAYTVQQYRESFMGQLWMAAGSPPRTAATNFSLHDTLAAVIPETVKTLDAAEHSWDFAGLIVNENGVHTTGKALMLKGRGWNGVLDLAPSSEGRAIFDSYTRS